MQKVNFRTINGLQLRDMLATGNDVPLHLPTPRNITVGDDIELTHGDRTKPTPISTVKVTHVHTWSTADGKQVQNLIVHAALCILMIMGGTNIVSAQVQTDCTLNGNTVSCTSVDTGARNREYAAMGSQLGQALGAGILRLRARHAEASEGKAWRKEQAKRAKNWCTAIGTPHESNPYTGTHCN